jgi:hypothetical protein
MQLTEIQPGVQFNYYYIQGRQLSVIGDRPMNNRFLQEGMDTNAVYRSATTGLSGVLLGVEAVKEFKVIATNATAEYGELSGGTINTIFKSGTNQLHGSAYEYFRDNVFDARNFFDQGQAPPFQRNQFGASLGGPIRHDKTFFFANYEGFRQNQGQSYLTTVPDNKARGTGNGFGSVPCSGTAATTSGGCGSGGSAVPSGTLVQVPVSAAIYNIFFAGSNPLMPSCNGANLGGGVCQFFSSPAKNTQEDYGLVKVDHSFGAKNTLSSSYNNDYSTLFAPTLFPNVAEDQLIHRQTFTLQDTQIVSTNVVNTARFGLNRHYLQFLTEDVVPIPPALFVNPQPIYTPSAFPQAPNVSVNSLTLFGITGSGVSNYPRWLGFTAGMFSDDVNYLHGKHAFQFGFQGKRWQSNIEIGNPNSRGTYTFTSLPQFLTGGPAQSFTWNIQNISSFARSMRLGLYALYGEDTFKVKTNLTITLGLRWEYVPGPGETHNRLASINNPDPRTATAVLVGGPYYNPSAHNFAPRIGFNWDPLKKGKTSVRGGFGIFYSEITDQSYYANVGGQPPFVTQVTLSNMPLPANLALANPGAVKPNYTGWMPDHPKTPTKYGYNLAVQQELPGHISFMLGYVGAQTRHNGRPMSWQDYDPIVQAPGSKIGCNLGVEPACGCPANGPSCLFWPGQGTRNANLIGVTDPNATLCHPPTIVANCFYNNNFGGTISGAAFDGNSFYNSVQMAVERRMTAGLSVRFNYTYSVCITDASDEQGGGASNGGSQGPVVALDHKSSRGRCGFEGTNSANLTLSYYVPFARKLTSGFAKKALDGWVITSQTAVASGVPFDLRNGINLARYATSGTGLDRPNWAPGCDPHSAINNHNPNRYFNPACFQAPQPGYLGNLGPMILTAPAMVNTDIGLKKTIPLRESMSIELGADMFNAFNRTNFASPENNALNLFTNTGSATAPVPTVNPIAGQITRTVTPSRQFQISGRFQF